MLQRLPLCLFMLAATVPNALRAETPMVSPPETGEMTEMFNGEDLTGWDGDPRFWSVRDGVIHGETTKEVPTNGNTFLIYQPEKPGDFELRFSFRCNAVNNSGVQYRSGPRKNAKNEWALQGYQHEIRNEVDFPNVPGFIYDEGGSRKRLVNVGEKVVWTEDGKEVLADDLISQEEFKKLMKLDEFNDVVIVAKGNHIQHYLNGRLLIDFTDNHPTKALSDGVIGLQLHAGRPMFAEFKNLRMKKL